jgi:hypothetical protein
MGNYLIYSKTIGDKRYEQWDGIAYESKDKAELALVMAKAWVKSKSILKKMKHQWKIVKVEEKTKKDYMRYGVLGFNPNK